jgi:hypothetical protein
VQGRADDEQRARSIGESLQTGGAVSDLKMTTRSLRLFDPMAKTLEKPLFGLCLFRGGAGTPLSGRNSSRAASRRCS